MPKRGILCSSIIVVLVCLLMSISSVAFGQQASSPGAAAFNRGMNLQKQGKLDEAAKEYQSAIKADPKLAAAYINLAGIHIQKQNDVAAIPLLEKAAQLEPKNGNIAAELSRLYVLKDRLADASREAKRAIDLGVKSAGPHFTLGVVAIKKKDFTSAVESFKKAIAINPKENVARVNLGYCYMQLAKYDLALSTYEQALTQQPDDLEVRRMAATAAILGEKNTQAIKHLEILHKKNPKDTNFTLGLAEAYDNANRVEDAKKLYLEVLASDKANFSALFNLGRHAFLANDTKEAKKYFAAAVAANPKNVGAVMNLALAELQEGDFANAEKHFRAALALDPVSKAGIDGLLMILVQQKRMDEAVEVLQSARAKNPGDATIVERLGNIWMEMAGQANSLDKPEEAAKYYAEAEKTYEALVAANPKNADAIKNLAGLYTVQKKYDDAIAMLRKLEALPAPKPPSDEFDPSNPTPTDLIADVLVRQNKVSEALDEYDKLLKKNPNSIASIEGKARVYEGFSNFAAAVAQWREIEKLRPKDTRPHHKIANLLLIQQDLPSRYDEAEAEYRAALSKDPKDRDAMNGLVRIYYGQKQYDKAIAELRIIEKTFGYKLPSPTAYAVAAQRDSITDMIATFYVEQQKYDEAANEFIQQIAKNPSDESLYHGLARVYEVAGQYDKAVGQYQKILSMKPADVSQVHYLLAKAYASLKDYESAIEQYEAIIAENPKDYRSMGAAGGMLEKANDYEGALKWYQKAIDISPVDQTAEMRISKSQVFAKMNKIAEAEKELEIAIAAEPKNNRPIMELGKLLLANQRSDEAAVQFNKVVELQPGNNEAREALLDIYRKQGKWDLAIEQVKKLGETDPAYASPTVIGRLLADADHIDEAIEQYEKAIEENKDQGTFYRLDLASMLVNKERYDDAVQQYTKLTTDRRMRVDGYLGIAETRAKQGRVDDAIQAYKQVILLTPTRPGVIGKCGELVRKQNKTDEWTAFLLDYIKRTDAGVLYEEAISELNTLGKLKDTIEVLQTLVSERPADRTVKMAYAYALETDGQLDAAISQCKRLLGASGLADVGVHSKLARLYEKQGKIDEATREHGIVAGIYEQYDRPIEALRAYKEVVRIDPENSEAQAAVARLEAEVKSSSVDPSGQFYVPKLRPITDKQTIE